MEAQLRLTAMSPINSSPTMDRAPETRLELSAAEYLKRSSRNSTACRAAVKGGDESRPEELKALAERVLLRDDVRYCPHGRPVCFELTRKELEKQFGRIV